MATTYNTLGQVVINGRTHWQQLDIQAQQRAEQLAYITLNNIYLGVQRGDIALTLNVSNTLRILVCKAYPGWQSMQDWWLDELAKLPRWLDF